MPSTGAVSGTVIADAEGEFTGMIESAGAGGLLRVRRENGISRDYAFKEIDYIL